MKIKKNEILLLIAALGVFCALAVYVWVYNPLLEKTDALEAENATQAVYVAQLEEWASKVDFYQEETEEMISDVNSILNRFPVDSKAEDAIMYAVELEGQDPQTYISSIGLNDPELIYEAAPTAVRLNDTDEQSEHTYRLYRQQITYTQEFTYDGMKRYVDAIVNNPNRKSIDTLNMAFDSSNGILVGSTTMNLFTVDGKEQEYRETTIPPRSMGTDNIFGTLE